ncbi:MAG: preprotein translocase subunit YajC [Planctomycetota bacterium]
MPTLSLTHLLPDSALLRLALQEGEAPGLNPNLNFLIMLGGLGLIFWFVLIGPERKEKKRKQAMIEALQKNDKVLLTSGLYATIAAVSESDLTVKFDDGNTRVRVLKSAIATVLDADEASGAAEKR